MGRWSGDGGNSVMVVVTVGRERSEQSRKAFNTQKKEHYYKL